MAAWDVPMRYERFQEFHKNIGDYVVQNDSELPIHSMHEH